MQSKKWELTRDKYMSLDEVRGLRCTSEERARSVNGLWSEKEE